MLDSTTPSPYDRPMQPRCPEVTLDEVTRPVARHAPNDGPLRLPRTTEFDAHAVTQGFDSGRLTLARERNRLTKTELATRLNLSPSAITQIAPAVEAVGSDP